MTVTCKSDQAKAKRKSDRVEKNGRSAIISNDWEELRAVLKPPCSLSTASDGGLFAEAGRDPGISELNLAPSAF